jgi:hypothetical protein
VLLTGPLQQRVVALVAVVVVQEQLLVLVAVAVVLMVKPVLLLAMLSQTQALVQVEPKLQVELVEILVMVVQDL